MVGFWGAPSSSINWCETDYAVTHYIAEFMNSMSNIPPIVLVAIAHYFGSKKYKSEKHFLSVQPKNILLAYLIPVTIYMGSFAFHASLTYTGQLLDELPMVYGVCYFHYVLLAHTPYSKLYAMGLVFTGVLITMLMIYLRESPLPLQICYTALVFFLVVQCVKIYRSMPILRESRLLFISVFTYVIATFCWLIDVHICRIFPEIEYLYLHAWWHLLTGVGTYYNIQFLCAHNLTIAGKDFKIGTIFFLPFVVPVEYDRHEKSLIISIPKS